jgi:hypothetical protein
MSNERCYYLLKLINKLRIGYGFSGRLPRVNPASIIRYKEWEIPPNVNRPVTY